MIMIIASIVFFFCLFIRVRCCNKYRARLIEMIDRDLSQRNADVDSYTEYMQLLSVVTEAKPYKVVYEVPLWKMILCFWKRPDKFYTREQWKRMMYYDH